VARGTKGETVKKDIFAGGIGGIIFLSSSMVDPVGAEEVTATVGPGFQEKGGSRLKRERNHLIKG